MNQKKKILGDVLEVDDKVRGNTVNIAARLQQLSTPDRMYVSESVLQTVKGKIDLTAVHIGLRKMKNIKEPISVYSIMV